MILVNCKNQIYIMNIILKSSFVGLLILLCESRKFCKDEKTFDREMFHQFGKLYQENASLIYKGNQDSIYLPDLEIVFKKIPDNESNLKLIEKIYKFTIE